jgi:ubiquinone biosynthesis protein UbiJ
MMEEFMELLKKKAQKQGGVKNDAKMQAKAAMAKELSDVLGGDIADGIKKVTVASSSKEGMKEGLEKAQELVEAKDMGEESEEESEESEMMESEEESEDEGEESEDDLSSKIAELEQQLEKLKSKRS